MARHRPVFAVESVLFPLWQSLVHSSDRDFRKSPINVSINHCALPMTAVPGNSPYLTLESR